jgi:CBS domain containing-hemolysin-like protein
MVPMAKVHSISAETSVDELLAKSEETKISRWPVTSATGEMIGLVNIFDVALDGRRHGFVRPFQRRIVKVAPNEPAYSMLRKLRAARTTVAAVIGNDAEPLGIVTWEELIKRIVSTAGK